VNEPAPAQPGEPERTDEDVAGLFVRASAFFGEQVRDVRDDEWFLPTPCASWDVRTVVAHVVVGDAQTIELFAGHPVQAVQEYDPSVLGTNPLAAWRGTALAAVRAASKPGALAERYPHPVGRVTGRHILGFRITDSVVHGWDVARACGREVLLDPEIVDHCLDFWLPLVSHLSAGGYFGAGPQMPPDGADGTARLLSLLGRDPAWAPPE
jgi:uncharacterized protein (TIGR03086 family)